MIFDLDQRTVALSVGEFADFSLGPREGGAGGAAGLWRAQLGTHWHNELRTQAVAEGSTTGLRLTLNSALHSKLNVLISPR